MYKIALFGDQNLKLEGAFLGEDMHANVTHTTTTTTWDIISTSPLQCTEALHVAFLARRTFKEAQFHFLQIHLLLHLYYMSR